MPRNGSGIYALPAGNPVVTGTTISSTVHNNTMSDIATEMTNSVDKDGQTVMTGDLDHNGNNIILDTDGDTYFDNSVDDQVTVMVGGASAIVLNSSGLNGVYGATTPAAITGTNITATGTLGVAGLITASDNIIMGAAKGIDFSANTGAAGETSSLLDWYEEGAWTPAFQFASGNTGVTYTSRVGRYTRIGRLVEIEGNIVLSAKGVSTGQARITGLPFTVGATIDPVGPLYAINIVSTGTPLIQFSNGNAYFVLASISDAGSASPIDEGDFIDTSNPVFTGTYNV